MLLTEIFLLSEKNIVSESKTKGEMVLRGTFQRANEVNQNGRRYKRSILEREVKKLQPIIKENRLLGELDHPQTEQVNLSNVAIMVTDLGWDGDDVIGECKLLSTPAGLTAQALIKDGVKLGISSRGLGTLTDIGESVKEVNDDYDMRTFDLVADPSTRGAFPGLMEGVASNKVGLLIESTKAKALGQRAYVVKLTHLLESKFKSKEKIINEAFKLNEGVTTGGDPIKTGIRVGQAAHGNPKKREQATRIGNKMQRKHEKDNAPTKQKDSNPKRRGKRARSEYMLGKMLGSVKAGLDADRAKNANEGVTTGGNPVETGLRVGKGLHRAVVGKPGEPSNKLKKKLDQYSRISKKVKARHGDFGAGSFAAASQLATRTSEATSISRKTPGARARFAKHLKSLRKGQSGASDAQVSNIAAQSAKAENPQSSFGKGKEFNDTLINKIGKAEDAAKGGRKERRRKYGYHEGISTGDSPVATGIRVGKALKKQGGAFAPKKKQDQSVRIGNKIHKRLINRYKEKDSANYQHGMYTGAKMSSQFEGRTTGSDPVDTGRRVGNFLKKAKQGKTKVRATDQEGNPLPSTGQRAVKITNKISKRFTKRYGKAGGEAAKHQFIGAKRATSEDN